VTFETSIEWARTQDRADPIANARGRFALPLAADGSALTYLCGHSLGLAPLAARRAVDDEIEDWERLGVLAHEHGRNSWIEFAERLQQGLALLAGARATEVVAMNSLSINLHLLLASFYRPTPTRSAILIESGAFSSDRHVVASQIAWHGLDPDTMLIELQPRAGEDLVRAEDVEARIVAAGERLALVLWPGVQYRTGQAFDLSRIVQAGHAVGAQVGFDLAHAIGNVPLALHDNEADFAVWCSYKYLNGGPGAIGGAYIHERHLARGLPRLMGWWGHRLDSRFELGPNFVPAAGASAWAVSNPPVFSAAPLQASLQIFQEFGMRALRHKSERLTGYLEFLIGSWCADDLTLVTCTDPHQRGCQLSVRVKGHEARGRRIYASLGPAGLICDWRDPDIIRLAPVPLYNTFLDVFHAAQQLAAVASSSS
jgi:kynureninase